ncbi:MAG TPA: class I tRNA ligase family protein, partial [Pseudobdellovibrionaceae bacterium]|nr:class I tRNA ligase family protein [Pseudobdellovibrionaceae bacterium]
FALQNLADFEVPAEGVKAIPPLNHLSSFDQWIVFKLAETEKAVEEALENDRFSDAAQALYHFIWHQFCDWYIEFTKPIMNGTDANERKATQLILAQVMNRFVRLLHPFCPFISEEIYSKLPIRGEACIIDQYPTVLNDREFLALGNEQAAFEIDLIKETILAIRNIRGENRLSPALKLKIRLGVNDAGVQKILGTNKTALMTLGRLEELEIGEHGDLKKCAVNQVTVKDASVKVIIPLEGLVDFDEEIKRIHKALEKLSKDIGMLTGKLSNEKFIQNADEEVVAADRLLLEQSKIQLISLQEALTRFQ